MNNSKLSKLVEEIDTAAWGEPMDKRLTELSAQLDELIEFQAFASLGRLLGNPLLRYRAGKAAAATAAPGVTRGGIRNYFARSAFDRPTAGGSPGPFATMGGKPPVAAPTAAARAAAPVNPAIPTPTPMGQAGRPGMATGFPSGPKAAEVAADKAATGMAPWKKWAIGGGIAGAGVGGYLLGSQNRERQMSAWLDDVIRFDRGKYITRTSPLVTSPEVSERTRQFWEKIASKPAGRSKLRQNARDLLAWTGKKKPKFGIRVGGIELSSTHKPIQFEMSEDEKKWRLATGAGAATTGLAAWNLKKFPETFASAGPWERKWAGRITKGNLGLALTGTGVAGGRWIESLHRRKLAEEGAATPRIFESAEEPIGFDNRPRNEIGQFQPYSGGGPSDPNQVATVYKLVPQEQHSSLGGTLLKGGALAVTGGALGQVGGEIGKKATSKAKELLARFKKAAPVATPKV